MGTEIVQTSGKCRPAKVGKDISELMYNLISTTTPHGHEYLLYGYIKDAIKDCKISGFGRDVIGNLYISVGKRGKDYKTMFSCHMDTSHPVPTVKNPPSLLVPLIVDYEGGNKTQENGMIYGAKLYFSEKQQQDILMPSILGADDKVGVYIMLRMIQKGINGLYVFHVGEERGCIGSHYSSTHNKDFFKGLQACIAFDRMHYGDVIAHQRNGRCASVKFTGVLAEKLNEAVKTKKPMFKGDVHGVYTDSANYNKLIPECTNISVGYWDQHGVDEHFDLIWLEQLLLPGILKLDWESLPIIRKTTDPESDYHYTSGATGGYGPWYNHNQKFKSLEKKPHEVDDFTPVTQCPSWKISDGIITAASKKGMIRIIHAAIKEEDWNMTVAQSIYEYLIKTNAITEEQEEEVPTKKNITIRKKKDLVKGEPKFKPNENIIKQLRGITDPVLIKNYGKIIKDLDTIITDAYCLMEEYSALPQTTIKTPQHLVIWAAKDRFEKAVLALSKSNNLPSVLDVDILEAGLIMLARSINNLPKISEEVWEMTKYILDTYKVW